MKIILGFCGQMASGKGTAVKYLKEKYGTSTYRFSTMLRDVLNRLYLDISRENMQKMSQVLRQNFGEDTLAKVMAEDVKNDQSQIIAIDGVRRPDDVKYLKQIHGFVLVQITAAIETRYERLHQRGENTDDLTKTFEEFKIDHLGEAEMKIEEISKEASQIIDNNGTLENLYRQLDELITKLKQNK